MLVYAAASAIGSRIHCLRPVDDETHIASDQVPDLGGLGGGFIRLAKARNRCVADRQLATATVALTDLNGLAPDIKVEGHLTSDARESVPAGSGVWKEHLAGVFIV